MHSIAAMLTTAANAMRVQMARAERAAHLIARGGLNGPAPAEPDAGAGDAPAPVAPPQEADTLDATVDLLLAQRAFAAQVRVIETADAVATEAVRLGERRAA
jgi:hypothetical protein